MNIRLLLAPAIIGSILVLLSACSYRGGMDHPGFERKNIRGSGSINAMSGSRQHRMAPGYRPTPDTASGGVMSGAMMMERKPQPTPTVLTGTISVTSSGSVKLQK